MVGGPRQGIGGVGRAARSRPSTRALGPLPVAADDAVREWSPGRALSRRLANRPEWTALKIYYATASPFARKCVVAAQELGLRARIELLPAAVHPVNRDETVGAHNPLGKIPTLIADDGAVLYDSRVICDYLNTQGDGRLVPDAGAARWRVLVDQSLADGIMDAAVLARYETTVRPDALRWDAWVTGQLRKVTAGLEEFEARASGLAGRVDLGTIALGCALGYLDFRFSSLAWRDRHPHLAAWFQRFAERESMAATRPAAA